MRKSDFDMPQSPALATPTPPPGMSDFNLYATAVLIWGSTWLAIKFQLGVVPPAVSVVWRFALSAFLLFAYAMWKRLPLRFAPGQHLWLALEGLAMFGINYVWVYLAEGYLTSGLVAVVFSLMVILNTILMRLFYGTPIRTSDALGAVIGIGGVVLVFWPEVARFSASGEQELGLAYAFGATLVASLGNMVAVRNQRRGLGTRPGAWLGHAVWRDCGCSLCRFHRRPVPVRLVGALCGLPSLSRLVRLGAGLRRLCHLDGTHRTRTRGLFCNRYSGGRAAALHPVRAPAMAADDGRRHRVVSSREPASSFAKARHRARE